MKDILYRKIFKALNEDLNMILSDDEFEEPEIDLGAHISNILRTVIILCLKKDVTYAISNLDIIKLKECIQKWDGKTALYSVNNANINTVIDFSLEALGDKANLNWIDTSNVTDMSYIFYDSKFNGDISDWDVSSVTSMFGMFWASKFNGDINRWDVSNVITMNSMFALSHFNGDISGWDVSNVTNMYCMFRDSDFNQDISCWDVSSVTKMTWMFKRCPLARKQNYLPNFDK